jgi:hypothetical protein
MSDGICPFATLLRGADWNQNGSRRLTVRAVTIHTTQGTNSVGLGASRHHSSPGTFNFLVGRKGELWQFYPAHVRCSHAAGSNTAGPGIENEGYTGNPLAAPQLATLGRLSHWLGTEYGVPLTYRTGDPRIYVDQTPDFRGFIAHRAVDYPPNTSYRHYDEITPAEWATAIGATEGIEEDEMTTDELVNVLRGEGISGGYWQAKLDETNALLKEILDALKASK